MRHQIDRVFFLALTVMYLWCWAFYCGLAVLMLPVALAVSLKPFNWACDMAEDSHLYATHFHSFTR